MGIALMTDIPDDFIARRIKDGMKRYGQLHNPKAGTQMAARFRNGRYGFVAQFAGKLLQLGITQLF